MRPKRGCCPPPERKRRCAAGEVCPRQVLRAGRSSSAGSRRAPGAGTAHLGTCAVWAGWQVRLKVRFLPRSEGTQRNAHLDQFSGPEPFARIQAKFGACNVRRKPGENGRGCYVRGRGAWWSCLVSGPHLEEPGRAQPCLPAALCRHAREENFQSLSQDGNAVAGSRVGDPGGQEAEFRAGKDAGGCLAPEAAAQQCMCGRPRQAQGAGCPRPQGAGEPPGLRRCGL